MTVIPSRTHRSRNVPAVCEAMRARFRAILLCVFSLSWAAQISAAEVAGLYEAEVPVASRDQQQRPAAFAEALGKVLVKLTGDSGTRLDADLAQDAARYVEQYRYRETAAADYPHTLWVRFDGNALERVFAERGLPLWDKERPLVLVWLAVQERGGRRYLVGETVDEEPRLLLEPVAAERGVPLMFPLLDAEDRTRVSFADVMGGFEEHLRNASARYNPDAVLLARATALGGDYWRVRWRLYVGQNVSQWVTQDRNIETALGQGIHRLASDLAQRLAIRPVTGGEGGTRVWVEGLESFQDYVRVTEYLTGLGPVMRLRPLRLDGHTAEFNMDVRGDPRDIERVIALGGTLEKADPVELTARVPDLAPRHTGPDAQASVLFFRLPR